MLSHFFLFLLFSRSWRGNIFVYNMFHPLMFPIRISNNKIVYRYLHMKRGGKSLAKIRWISLHLCSQPKKGRLYTHQIFRIASSNIQYVFMSCTIAIYIYEIYIYINKIHTNTIHQFWSHSNRNPGFAQAKGPPMGASQFGNQTLFGSTLQPQ